MHGYDIKRIIKPNDRLKAKDLILKIKAMEKYTEDPITIIKEKAEQLIKMLFRILKKLIIYSEKIIIPCHLNSEEGAVL